LTKPSRAFTAHKGATPQTPKPTNPPRQSLRSPAALPTLSGSATQEQREISLPQEQQTAQRICFYTHTGPKNSRATPERAMASAQESGQQRAAAGSKCLPTWHFSPFFCLNKFPPQILCRLKLWKNYTLLAMPYGLESLLPAGMCGTPWEAPVCTARSL